MFITNDDALFCEKISSEKTLIRILKSSGLSSKDIENGYITVQFHFWGIEREKDRLILMDKIKKIIDECSSEFNKKVIFILMTPLDEEPVKLFTERFSNNSCPILKADYDFKIIRGVIGKSDLCLTMKHHPIIFAIGEKTPVISLSSGKYYEHKNIGALELFGMEKFNVRLDTDEYLSDIKILFKAIKKSKNIYKNIDVIFDKMKNEKMKFINLIKKDLQ